DYVQHAPDQGESNCEARIERPEHDPIHQNLQVSHLYRVWIGSEGRARIAAPERHRHRIRRDASRKLGLFPSPTRGPRDACVPGWLWGGARGGGTLANREAEESAPTPNPFPHSQRKHAARGGGEHAESASPFPLKCNSPALSGGGTPGLLHDVTNKY